MALLPEDPATQKKLLYILIPVVLVFAYWYLYHGETVAEIQAMEQRLEQLVDKNTRARMQASRGGPEMEQKLAVYEQHMERLEALIPSGEELPEMLHRMAEQADETGVDLALVRPAEESKGQFYTQRVYEMAVIGSYHDIASFLAAIGSLERIVTPIDLELGRSRLDSETGVSLEAQFRIRTYVLPNPTEREVTNAST